MNNATFKILLACVSIAGGVIHCASSGQVSSTIEDKITQLNTNTQFTWSYSEPQNFPYKFLTITRSDNHEINFTAYNNGINLSLKSNNGTKYKCSIFEYNRFPGKAFSPEELKNIKEKISAFMNTINVTSTNDPQTLEFTCGVDKKVQFSLSGTVKVLSGESFGETDFDSSVVPPGSTEIHKEAKEKAPPKPKK